MTSMQTKVLVAAALLTVALALPEAAHAEGYGYQYGGNYGNQRQIDWYNAQGIHTQRPGAAIVGSLLGGIGRGLAAADPQRHAVASNVLGGLSQGFTIASEPTVWGRGGIRENNQGYYNNWGGGQNWSGSQPYPPRPGFGVAPGPRTPFFRGW